jgi:hypothetical protein
MRGCGYWCVIGLMAWVMWTYGYMPGNNVYEKWDVIDAFETNRACLRELDSLKKSMLRQKGWSLKGGTLIYQHDGAPVHYLLSCLPDSVDPRPSTR